jgi:hypothetical protein
VADAVINHLSFTRRTHIYQAHALTPLGVLHSEHRNFVNSSHLREREFDLSGIDIDAAGDNEIAATALEIDVSVVVDATEIPDSEPVAIPRFARLFGIIPILESGVIGNVTPESAL